MLKAPYQIAISNGIHFIVIVSIFCMRMYRKFYLLFPIFGNFFVFVFLCHWIFRLFFSASFHFEWINTLTPRINIYMFQVWKHKNNIPNNTEFQMLLLLRFLCRNAKPFSFRFSITYSPNAHTRNKTKNHIEATPKCRW